MNESKYVSLAPRSLWMRQALDAGPQADAPALRGDQKLDVCVVGGGLSGLWSALHIARLEPSIRVGVVESDICGAGASGANGGFAMTWWPKFATLTKLMSTDDALRTARASEEAVREMGEFCRANGDDVEFAPAGWLWSATNTSQLASWDDVVTKLASLGESPFRVLTREEVVSMGASERHLGGVFEAGVATVQPALLVRSLRRAALAAGVSIWEETPMLGYEESSGAVKVRVPGATITTSQLILATNAWLARYAQIRRHLLVLGSDVVASAPARERLDAIGWTSGLAISDSRRLVHYYRTTNEGRVVFGKGGGRIGFRSSMNRSTWATALRGPEVIEQLRRTYPTMSDVPITNRWSGAVDYSADSMPFFGHLGESRRIHFGVGFSGNGVGPSLIAGKILASLALERDDEWARSPMIRTPGTRLPAEPFRFVGGTVVRAALRRKEAAQDQERKPSSLDVRLAGLDPTSFVG
ncbi:MAG: FAD-dependent oxidoreductase [Acidimicrobiaceae bacterium]|nr:FAD-dependent oxidoreductase [Acidimicrobiaceae bacterium]